MKGYTALAKSITFNDLHEVVNALTTALDAKSHYTCGHSERVAEFALLLSKGLALSLPEQRRIHIGAHLHDIGKIGIPDHILLKPTALNTEEWQILKKHCEIGYRIAHASHELRPIANWILKHHEHWDGLGYPLGLAGPDIPYECRLLAIVDSYDAMISDRPYRQGMSHHAALQELERCSGSQFDPALTRLFLGMITRKEIDNVQRCLK